jgi:biopolymer transport protein ExbD
MLSSGLPVDLPMATTTVQVNDVGQHIVISMTANGDWAVEQEIIEGEDTDMLIRMVQAEFNTNPERSILVKADRGLEYGAVRVLMDALAEHRFTAIFIAAGKEG